MDGQRLYKIHTQVADALGVSIPTWEELSSERREAWEAAAHEQELRDRESPNEGGDTCLSSD